VDIADAYKLLSPTLGAKAASIIFALALLASGQNSTITGTLAGQVVCEGEQQAEAQLFQTEPQNPKLSDMFSAVCLSSK
jgi:Mn2+/Fe2+ NRAMP family transporter